MDLEFHQLDLRYELLRRRAPEQEKRLLASLALSGQQTPIVVVGCEGNSRVVVDGYKRVRALRQLGERLVDLHGQHEHQSLLDPSHHARFLDESGGRINERGLQVAVMVGAECGLRHGSRALDVNFYIPRLHHKWAHQEIEWVTGTA